MNRAAPLAFRAKRNKCENKQTIMAEELAKLKQQRRGGQWKGQVKISDDFDVFPEAFSKYSN